MKNKLSWISFERFKEFKDDILGFIAQASDINQKFGLNPESNGARFSVLQEAIQGEDAYLKIVIVGEYSRGKSSLINALLGEKLLPTALSQTTCINTFIQKIHEGEKPYIKVVFRDNTQEILQWKEGIIETWGSELGRKENNHLDKVQKIMVYSAHPLFKNDIILIDTPGLEGLAPMHEEIARRAMDESHVAIWILSAQQLGGTKTEWTFLNESLSKNYIHFLTIVNMWDLVHEEIQEKKLSESHTQEKLNMVRSNFRAQTKLRSEAIQQLTNENNLFGVSARWALSDDSSSRNKSGIEKMAKRIQEMATSPEVKKQIFLKPLKTLLDILSQLQREMQQELEDLERNVSVQELKKEQEHIEFEKNKFDHDKTARIKEAKLEHQFLSVKFVKETQNKLVEPLKQLKSELDITLDRLYVEEQVQKGIKQIELPEQMRERYRSVMGSFQVEWDKIKDDLSRTLMDLQAEFIDFMKTKSVAIHQALSNTTFELPEFSFSLSIDLSAIEHHQLQKIELETEAENLEQELTRLETSLDARTLEEQRVEMQQSTVANKLERIRLRSEALGPRPSPMQIQKTGQTSGGIYSRGTSYTYYDTDNSNVKQWSADRDQLKCEEGNQEEALAEIQKEYFERRGQRITTERAKKEYQKRLEQKQRDKSKVENELRQAFDRQVDNAFARLKQGTIGQIEKIVHVLEDQLQQIIEKAFHDQLLTLEKCVRQQYEEPTENRITQLGEIQKKINEGEQEVNHRKQRLKEWLNELAQLQQNSEDCSKQIAS